MCKKNAEKILFIFSLFVGVVFSGCKKSDETRKNELIVYTYNSFSGEWGAGPEIARLFEEKTGIKVIFADCGDSGQILAKAITEKDNPYADVLIGIDNNYAQKAHESAVLYEYKPSGAEKFIPLELSDALNDGAYKWLLTPYDYSHFAFIYNSNSNLPVPECLEDLTKSIYSKKIIIMDYRTSSLGVGLDKWIEAVYKDKADAYLERLKPSILTVAPNWSVGYGMFTEGEAPICFSYTTSPAYHVEYGEGNQYKTLVFEDGHVMQVEGAGIVNGAPNLEGAKLFMDFLISEEAQKIIPLTQWMFPANKNVKLPASYGVAPVPKTVK